MTSRKNVASRPAARPVHPNQRLGRGRGQRAEDRRQRVRELLEDYVDEQTGEPPSYAAIAAELGISRERVRVLAGEVASGQAGTRKQRKRKKE